MQHIKGRGKGTKNYDKDRILDLIEEILPSSSEEWNLLANKYKEITGEDKLRQIGKVFKLYSNNLI